MLDGMLACGLSYSHVNAGTAFFGLSVVGGASAEEFQCICIPDSHNKSQYEPGKDVVRTNYVTMHQAAVTGRQCHQHSWQEKTLGFHDTWNLRQACLDPYNLLFNGWPPHAF